MNLINLFKVSKIIFLEEEPSLEKWARQFRYEQSLPIIRKQLERHRKILLLDVGCGQDTLFYKYLQYYFPNDMSRIEYVGLDPLINQKLILNKNIQTVKSSYEDYFRSTENKYHIIVLFAVLEHVDDPKRLLLVLSQLLKMKGYLIGTTPSLPAKPLLEFLSYKLGLISPREIEEHKNYFDKKLIRFIFEEISKRSRRLSFYHKYFEFGLNNLFVIRKT